MIRKDKLQKDNDRIIHRELSYRVMEAVFEVHNTLGPGFAENAYEEALTYELGLRGIPFERQKAAKVTYKGRVVGNHRLDIVVDNKIVLELKATSTLSDAFKHQVVSYLRALDLRLGILINFATSRVEYIRIVN